MKNVQAILNVNGLKKFVISKNVNIVLNCSRNSKVVHEFEKS